MSSQVLKKTIQVYGRLKPIISNTDGSFDESQEYKICSSSEKKSQTLVITNKPIGNFINHKPKSHTFQFRKVFDQDTDQQTIFEVVAKPVVDSVLKGYNGTVFAYGQTGSGKTYTISGIPDIPNQRGIVQRSFQHIFEAVEKNTEEEFCISMSYWEIHNEHGYDLLNPLRRINQLECLEKVVLQENKEGDVQLRNLSLHLVSSFEEAMALLAVGDTNRMIAETTMNQSSSRSHCILTLHLTIRQGTDDMEYRGSKLHLVDLAGSERVYKTGIDGQILVEACHINLSLHYLEQVIVALSESNRNHVPYRNSVMTIALKDSLGGNCLTVMIANLATDVENTEETISTCRFAQRVAMVRNQPRINVKRDPHKEIEMLKAEIRNLKSQLSVAPSYEVPTVCEVEEEEEVEHDKNDLYEYMENHVPNLQDDIISLMSVLQDLLRKNDTFVQQTACKTIKKVLECGKNPFTGEKFTITQQKEYRDFVYTKRSEFIQYINDSKEFLLNAEENINITADNLYKIQQHILTLKKEQFQSEIQEMITEVKEDLVIFDVMSDRADDLNTLLLEHSEQLQMLQDAKSNFHALKRNIKDAQQRTYFEFIKMKNMAKYDNNYNNDKDDIDYNDDSEDGDDNDDNYDNDNNNDNDDNYNNVDNDDNNDNEDDI